MSDVVKLVPLKQNAEDHARANTERNQRLFDWADAVLERLGIVEAVIHARSIEELNGIVLDPNSAEVTLAIRDALHPASGRRAEHFHGLKEGGLKLILRNRFAEMKKTRTAQFGVGTDQDQDRPRFWTDDLMRNSRGEIVSILANIILVLQKSPSWQGVLGYDEFNRRVVIRKRPPWDEEAPDAPWTDHHESMTRVWFQRESTSNLGQDWVNLPDGANTDWMNPSASDVGRAVEAAARANTFHPVRDYFSSLVWDGTPRLDTWLQEYLRVADSEYVRAIGPRFLISVVARIYDPGCKVDHVLVLEGPQGKFKSEALRTLAVNNSWFTDRLSHVASKDAALELAGVMLVEMAEMDALTRATSSATKAFLTRRHDRFRPPYGKHTVNLPRQCVFTATINPSAGGYLKDPTGARRFWPVACNGMIDRAGLERARDQLWAEAVCKFRGGAAWWLETPELEALATVEQSARFVVDVWEDPIRRWLKNRNDVSIWEVFRHALKIDHAQVTPAAHKRVVAVLDRLGFKKTRPRTSRTVSGREHRYRRKS